jgi:hypothetical protein
MVRHGHVDVRVEGGQGEAVVAADVRVLAGAVSGEDDEARDEDSQERPPGRKARAAAPSQARGGDVVIPLEPELLQPLAKRSWPASRPVSKRPRLLTTLVAPILSR